MNMLSSCTYNLSQVFKKIPNCTITRAQTHELIAVFLGTKSFAALKENSLFPLLTHSLSEPITSSERCKSKALKLGQNLLISEKLAALIHNELNNFKLKSSSLINKQALKYLLLKAQNDDWDEYEAYEEDEIVQPLDMKDSFQFEGFTIYINELYESLLECSNNGDKESKLLEFLWIYNDLSSISYDETGKDSYELSQLGHPLDDRQKALAQNYHSMIKEFERLWSFIANTKTSDFAAPDIEALISSNATELPDSICYHLDIDELFDKLSEHWNIEENYNQQWNKLSALKTPCREFIAELMDSESDLIKQHSWLEFAKANDLDLEEDDMYLVNSYTGEIWEHDFDGPVYADGYEGITLPQLPLELKPQVAKRVEAMLNIQKLISKL